jgi:hypothetical protein
MRFNPSRQNRKIFGKIAEEYDLVYFGTVDPQVDSDYKAVRGVTAAAKQLDDNYTTGNVYDYEVAFLQRARQVRLVNGQTAKRQWTILQVQLKQADLPHIFIDEQARTEEFGSLIISFLRLSQLADQHFSSPNFNQTFAVYARPESLSQLYQILTPEVQDMLAAHFRAFDYEIEGDKLLVYATNIELSLQTLDQMLRVGLWLARHLDS